VVVGGKRANRLLGPLAHVAGSRLAAMFSGRKAVFFLAKLAKDDMETLRDLLEAGKLRSVVDSTYPLERLADALGHMGGGHPQGKIVVTSV
jgi:NADPH:quinone reductase-like Zn-dependent oxidoreductase